MSPSARRACACLLLFAAQTFISATPISRPTPHTVFANAANASMQVSVTVVRSCSVSTPASTMPSGFAVTVECHRGSVDAVNIGVNGSSDSAINPIVSGPNRVELGPRVTQMPAGTSEPLTVRVDF